MKKKILALVLCLVLALTAIGGTLAYFTDTEEAVNTFTVGNVDIQLLESQYYTNVDEASDADIRRSAENYAAYLAEAGKNVVPGREFMKAIYVDNTGNNAAYVRVRVVVTDEQFKSFYFTENTTALENSEMTKTIIGHKNGQKTTYADVAAAKAAIADWDTLEYIYTYTDALQPGDLTDRSPVWKFTMKYELDNEDVNNFSEDDLKIAVYADAIQAEGFESAADAFAAFDEQEVGEKVESPQVGDKTDTKFGTEAGE